MRIVRSHRDVWGTPHEITGQRREWYISLGPLRFVLQFWTRREEQR